MYMKLLGPRNNFVQHTLYEVIRRLDRDDTNGEGPETITILKVDPKASYTFFVHDFSNGSSVKSKQLSESGAVVRVYGDNKLMNNFYIKADQKGTKWLVFELKNGVVKEWNRIEQTIKEELINN